LIDTILLKLSLFNRTLHWMGQHPICTLNP